MTLRSTILLVCLAASSSTVGFAASGRPASTLAGSGDPSPLPDAPGAGLTSDFLSSRVRQNFGPSTGLRLRTSPFSAVAIGVTTGVGGIGVDVATPLATKINLRGSFSFLNYNPVLTEEGITFDGSIRFRSVGAGVDIYPYRNTFHITPGVTMYNGNKATAVTAIVPGSTFTINDTAYVSDIADPVHGTFNVNLGRKFAPSLTVGFGNMLRRDSHWSFPFDIGIQYVGQPKFLLKMTGTVCDTSDGCTPIATDQATQQNLAQEQLDINKDISPLRFYPILKAGISYRFGHKTDMSMWR